MTINSPRLRTLLRQAQKVADNGKREAALSLYQQILDEAPESEEALLGVAELTLDKGDQEAAYRRLDPAAGAGGGVWAAAGI